MPFPSSLANGSQACTITTVHTLQTVNGPATVELHLDVNALAADETLEVAVNLKVLSGGTVRNLFTDNAKGGATEKIWRSGPIVILNAGATFTIMQPTGTGRTIDWNIAQLS
jgi:hypothetical protein